MKRLSIIIPCYNAEPYIHELLNVLNPQITNEVEVIIVDDGSAKEFKTEYKWATVIRQTNGGASKARNTGLDNAKGEYIAFIDADDLVANNYVQTILDKINSEQFDYCYLSWKTMAGGWQCEVKLNSVEDKFPPFNLCVWNRIYRKDMIGDVRFNLLKLIAEDAEFIRDVHEEGKKKAFVGEFMYYYRSSTPNSLTKRFSEGQLYTKRIVYNYNHVTINMVHLIDEFKEADATSEVILMTNCNDIPELEKYAMVMKPCQIKGTELRGEPTPLFIKVELPYRTQIVIYTNRTFAIGGIETFIYNFCMQMKEYYDITVLYDEMDIQQIKRLQPYVRVMRNFMTRKIVCDTLIINRITDKAPENVSYGKKIQMVHACKMVSSWRVPTDNDCIVAVSDICCKTYPEDIEGHEHRVINNMTYNDKKSKGALRLISATRLTTFEKGQSRMIDLAKLLCKNNVPFVWTYFADQKLSEEVEGMVYMKPRLDISEYIKSSDFLVQLSDSESFCYSIVESLELGVPVITTPIDVLSEIGVVDGENAYIVPFDIDDNVDVNKFYNHRLKKFKYDYDNEKRIQQWRELLGNTIPLHDYQFSEDDIVMIKVISPYFSNALRREMSVGEVIETTRHRAEIVMRAKRCIILEG